MIEKIQFMALMFLNDRKAFLNDRKAKFDERGATAVEYGLLVALIGAVIVATVAALGGYINDAFTTINDELKP